VCLPRSIASIAMDINSKAHQEFLTNKPTHKRPVFVAPIDTLRLLESCVHAVELSTYSTYEQTVAAHTQDDSSSSSDPHTHNNNMLFASTQQTVAVLLDTLLQCASAHTQSAAHSQPYKLLCDPMSVSQFLSVYWKCAHRHALWHVGVGVRADTTTSADADAHTDVTCRAYEEVVAFMNNHKIEKQEIR
jgi:hypothetical protein